MVFRKPKLSQISLSTAEYKLHKQPLTMRRKIQKRIKMSKSIEESQENTDDEDKIKLQLNAKNPMFKEHI